MAWYHTLVCLVVMLLVITLDQSRDPSPTSLCALMRLQEETISMTGHSELQSMALLDTFISSSRQLLEGFEHRLIDGEVKATVMNAVRAFERIGATVEEVSLPLHLEGPAIWTIQQRIAGTLGMMGYAHGRRGLFSTAYEAARQPWTNETFQKLFPSTKNTMINGLSLMQNYPGLYAKTMNIAQQLRDSYEKLFQEYDLIIMPTTPFVAPKNVDWRRGDPPIEALKPSMGITINTAIFNVTGHPALSLPVGFASSSEDPNVRLPVGMQIVGGLWQEQMILNAAYSWELANDWTKIGVSGESQKLPTKL
jgi:amidase